MALEQVDHELEAPAITIGGIGGLRARRLVGRLPVPGPPAGGVTDDEVTDSNNVQWVCTAPGVWAQATADGWFKLGAVVLGSNAASIDFAGIAATYKHLRLMLELRSDAALLSEPVYVSFNTDVAAANYDSERILALSNVVTATEIRAGAEGRLLAYATSANAQANAFAMTEATIFDYASTTKLKIAKRESALWNARTTNNIIIESGMLGWASTAAINRITLTPSVGPNFVAGSSVDLYGLKAGA